MTASGDKSFTSNGILNAMTVDVEEHFQVSAFEGSVSRDDWHRHPSRVTDNTSRLLDMLDDASVKATFFVLGWIAEKHPSIVGDIARRGHEIASHGYDHRLVYSQSPGEFREGTRRSQCLLQDQCGQPVVGYRAASFSIGASNLWAFDVLADLGFEYDSSVFPVVHDRYGMPNAPRRIHAVKTSSGATIVEVPPSTLRFAKVNIPVAGGGYLRFFPLSVTRRAIRRLNTHDKSPAVVYIHPWEIDPGQPRLEGPWRSRFRHYTGLKRTRRRLIDLMGTFRFGTVREIIEQTLPNPSDVQPGLDVSGNRSSRPPA